MTSSCARPQATRISRKGDRLNDWQKLWSAWLPPGMQWPGVPAGEDKEVPLTASDTMAHLTEQILASQRQVLALFANPAGSRIPSAGASVNTVFAPFQAMFDTWTAAAGQLTSVLPASLPNFGLADTVSQLVDHPALIGNKHGLERLAQKAFQSSLDVQQAVASHQLVTAKGWQSAFARFAAEFQGGGSQSAEEVRTLDQLIGLWIRVGEQALQEHARSPEFLESQSRLLRAAMTCRLDQRRVMEAFARMHDLPTQSDVDEAFKLIHELRREVRLLRKQAKPSPRREPRKTKDH